MADIQPINPYASPVYPEEALPDSLREDEAGLTATFTFTEEDQLTSVEVEEVPLSRWVVALSLSSTLAALALLLIGIGFEIAIGLAVLTPFVIVVGQYLQTQEIRKLALQKLGEHPVLGRIGTWQLTFEPEWITVTTAGGTKAFRRATMITWTSEHQLVFWFDGMPIVIPSMGNYAAMCDEIRRWLRTHRPAAKSARHSTA